MNSKRLFIGIPLKKQTKSELTDFQMKQLYDPKINWVAAPNLHITLNFIGDFPVHELPWLKDKLSGFFRNYDSFELEFMAFQLIPPNKPNMLWATFKNSDQFIKLSLDLAKILSTESKNKPTPHITLARFKPGADNHSVKLASSVKLPPVTVNKIHLYESVLKPDGPEYSVVETYLL